VVKLGAKKVKRLIIWDGLSNKHILNDKLIAPEQEYKMTTDIGYLNIYRYFLMGTKKKK
jgi:hypothetical protein